MAGRAVMFAAGIISLGTAMLGVMSEDGSTAEGQQHEEERLHVECNLKRLLAGRTFNSMQEICGDGFHVDVWGLSYDNQAFPDASFPWTFEMTLQTEPDDTTTVISLQFQIEQAPPSDDITEIINDFFAGPEERSITIPEGKCDNRDGLGMIKFYSVSWNKEFSEKEHFMVLCDFSDDDLKLVARDYTDNSYVSGQVDTHLAMTVDWATTPLGDLVTKTSLADIKVVVEGHVPLLEPDDACVFAIAYLTAKDMASGGEEYMESADEHYYDDDGMTRDHFPKIAYHDTLIGTPKCLRAAQAEEHDLLQIIKDSEDFIHLCGDYTLVLEVDPFGTMHNEKDKTNNFLTFDFHFACVEQEKPAAQCEILTSGFGGSGFQTFDTKILFHDTKEDPETHQIHRYTQLFNQEEKSWGPVISDRDDPRGLQKHGYGLLKVYNKFLMSEFSENECTNFDNDDVVQSTISHIEGLDAESLKPSANLADLVPQIYEAKTRFDSLKTLSDKGKINQTRYEAWQLLREHMGSPSSMFDFAKQRSLISAYNMTKIIAEALLSDTDPDLMRYYANLEMCMVSIGLESLPYLFHMMQDPDSAQYAFNSVMDTVGNLTRIVFSARYFYPELACLENMLINLLDFIKKLDMQSALEEDLEWMFDSDQVRDVKANGEKIAHTDCGLRINKCVKKVHSVCAGLTHPEFTVKPVADNREDICFAKYLKRKSEEQYKILGLLGLKDELSSEDMDDKCRNDPLAPQKGPLTLYKIVDESVGQVMYKGIPSLDNMYFEWKKEAVCTCRKCHGDKEMKKK